MEDVVELLREHNQPVPTPLELPTDDDLLDVQEQILIHCRTGARVSAGGQ